MIEQLHIFYHSIKADFQFYSIYCLLIGFIVYQQTLSWLNEIGQGYERPKKRKA